VPLAPVRWERLAVAVDGAPSFAALADRIARRVEEQRDALDGDLCAVVELAGRTPYARSLRDPAERSLLEEELRERAQVLELELRADDVRRPRDLTDLRNTPSVLQQALALVETVQRDPAARAALAPEPLVGLDEAAGVAREEYLAELVAGLDEELLERALEGEER